MKKQVYVCSELGLTVRTPSKVEGSEPSGEISENSAAESLGKMQDSAPYLKGLMFGVQEIPNLWKKKKLTKVDS